MQSPNLDKKIITTVTYEAGGQLFDDEKSCDNFIKFVRTVPYSKIKDFTSMEDRDFRIEYQYKKVFDQFNKHSTALRYMNEAFGIKFEEI